MPRTCWNLQKFILKQFAETRCRGPHIASVCVPGVRFCPVSVHGNPYMLSSYFGPSELNGAVFFPVESRLLKKRPVGPTFAPESSDAHNLTSRPPNDACYQALNSLQTYE